jgi:pyruvate/2-oxoacid:ferredoxin oxidoreductase beta subunit
MNSFLNKERPLVFCPGCTHEKITRELDKTFIQLELEANNTVIVTDIGCSGLFDTFFNTHALHGLHGRALTYATGLKMSNPELNVIVTMGDGGLGIGGAHVLSACRRNLDLTLIVLNNFNFGMTGGQYSATTPSDAVVGSEFLNRAEVPIDICAIAKSAGATYVKRCSGHDKNLSDILSDAIRHKGFSIVETLGICTGRFTKQNKITPKIIEEKIEKLPLMDGVVETNTREEYGSLYGKLAAEKTKFPEAIRIEKKFDLKDPKREEIVILGSAGMRIVTAGDIVCYAGLLAGLNVSQKNDYNITVLRGQSVSEMIISPHKIGYAGIHSPTVIVALSAEGVVRRKEMFKDLGNETFILKAADVDIPETSATVVELDFKDKGIKKHDRALASLGVIAQLEKVLTLDMLQSALKLRFKKSVFDMAWETIEKAIH